MKLSVHKESPFYAEWACMTGPVMDGDVDLTELGITYVDTESGEFHHWWRMGDETRYTAVNDKNDPMERISVAKNHLWFAIPENIRPLVEEWKQRTNQMDQNFDLEYIGKYPPKDLPLSGEE